MVKAGTSDPPSALKLFQYRYPPYPSKPREGMSRFSYLRLPSLDLSIPSSSPRYIPYSASLSLLLTLIAPLRSRYPTYYSSPEAWAPSVCYRANNPSNQSPSSVEIPTSRVPSPLSSPPSPRPPLSHGTSPAMTPMPSVASTSINSVITLMAALLPGLTVSALPPSFPACSTQGCLLPATELTRNSQPLLQEPWRPIRRRPSCR
jgi:hypothetical protein